MVLLLGIVSITSSVVHPWFTHNPDHYGVVRAFLDAGVLPRVITGTSAGGLIAALTACYTEEELKEILIPELAERLTACDEPFSVWGKRLWETGARFDSVTYVLICSVRPIAHFLSSWARKVRIYTDYEPFPL